VEEREVIDKIQELIDKGVGDTARLSHIKDSINAGKKLYKSDQNYLEEIISKNYPTEQIKKIEEKIPESTEKETVPPLKKEPRKATDKIEKMSRIPPDPKTLKELFRLSGNRCAFSRCKKKIVDPKDFSTGFVCSIESNEIKQPRYNSDLSTENRIKIDNLILLCVEHFCDTELKEKKFSIKKLMKMKTNSESSSNKSDFAITDDQISEISQKYVDNYPSKKCFAGLTKDEIWSIEYGIENAVITGGGG